MTRALIKNSYGKSRVRLTKVIRHPDHHDLIELSADIELFGDFARAYTDGDNSTLVATDTMKNSVYAVAADHPMISIESFARSLADHFLKKYSHISAVTVDLRQDRWIRVDQNHPHAFVTGGDEKRTCHVGRQRTPDSADLTSGIDGLVVVKTGNSAFTGYIRDELTLLPETTDRIMGTSITANWKYEPGHHDYNAIYDRSRKALIDAFAAHKSASVQHTLLEMGKAVLDACPEIQQVDLVLPNQHRIPFNLQPLGLPNRNEIFIPTDEPFGLIKGTVARN